MLINNIYEEVISLSNIRRAARRTLSNGRKFKGSGANFFFNLESEIFQIHRELVSGKYRHDKYNLFHITDPKLRVVAAAKFRDRVVHHCVHDIIEPLFDRIFIYDSYACRNGKGTHQAIERATGFLRANKYFVHLDVVSYFQNIDHSVLEKILERYIRDEKVMKLLTGIIDSTRYLSNQEKFKITKKVVAYQDFDLFGTGRKGTAEMHYKGLPLGNLTSQFFANLYLNELDQYAKHKLKCKYYIRYMDDVVIFSNDKTELRDFEAKIREFASNNLSLVLHNSGGAEPYYKGLSFLGMRIYRSYRKIKRTAIPRCIRRMKKLIESCKNPVDEYDYYKKSLKIRASYNGFKAYIKLGNSEKMIEIIESKIEMNKVRIAYGITRNCLKNVRIG